MVVYEVANWRWRVWFGLTIAVRRQLVDVSYVTGVVVATTV
jgi:hypothetical protein